MLYTKWNVCRPRSSTVARTAILLEDLIALRLLAYYRLQYLVSIDLEGYGTVGVVWMIEDKVCSELPSNSSLDIYSLFELVGFQCYMRRWRRGGLRPFSFVLLCFDLRLPLLLCWLVFDVIYVVSGYR